MRLSKSLLCGISALLLAFGTAFAGQDSTMASSVESGSPELLGGPEMMAGEMAANESLEEIDVLYVYPVEVTEYYLIVPSQSSEMPG